MCYQTNWVSGLTEEIKNIYLLLNTQCLILESMSSMEGIPIHNLEEKKSKHEFLLLTVDLRKKILPIRISGDIYSKHLTLDFFK